MGKVKKILLRILLYTVGTVIFLPILLAGLLCIPAVQTFVVQRAAVVISSKLGTTVSVGSIYIKPFSSVEVKDFYVEDYQKDTLLNVGTLAADIRVLGIFDNRYALGVVTLDDASFYLQQNAQGVMNLTEILNKLKSDKPKESTQTFRLEAFGLDISRLKFRYRKNEIPQKDYGVNFSDLQVDDFNLKASSIYLVDDSVSLTISSLQFNEKSGFKLNRLASDRVIVSGTGLRFDKLTMVTPESDIDLPHLDMIYPAWGAYKDFINQVNFDAVMQGSRLSFATIAYFAPSLREWRSELNDVDITMNGPISDFSGKINNIRTLSTTLQADYHITGIPDIEKTDFKVKIAALNTTAGDIDFIAQDIAHKSLGSVMTTVGRAGDISLSGNFSGLLSRFAADASLRTAIGGIDARLTVVNPSKRNMAIDGVVIANRVDVGALVGSKFVGRASLAAKVNGQLSKKGFKLDTDANLSEIFLNGKPYTSIEMNGVVENRMFHGDILSRDENLDFDFKGLLSFNDSIPFYDFDLDLHKADLARLGLNKRDSVSLLSCRVLAYASGRSVDELNGNITIDDVLYVSPADSVRANGIVIRGENSADSKMLTITSPFADAEFRSRMSYAKLVDYITYTVQEYFPTLSSRTVVEDTFTGTNATDISNYSIIKLRVKEANNVAGLFVPGLELAKGTNLQFLFNPAAKQLSLSLKSDYIESHNFFLANLDMNSRNQADSLVVYLRADEFLLGNMRFPNLSIIGGAKNSVFNVSTRFSDKETGSHALIGLRSSLGKDPETGAPQINVRFQPSTFSTINRSWRLSARDILVDSTKVVVKNFRLSSEGQELSINGIASKSTADTLKVKVSNFDLSTFSRLTTDTGYDIAGVSNGYANLASAMKRPLIFSQLTFDSVKVNNIEAPPFSFDSRWDFKNERAKFTVANRTTQDTLLVGYFRPTDKRLRIDANIKGLDLSLLNPPLSSVINGTKGIADAKILVTGTSNRPKINGTIAVHNLSTQVDFTKVTYTLPQAEMTIADNIFTVKPTAMYDSEKNRGDLELKLDLNSLKNIIYELKVRPNKMLVLNTTPADNDAFYGKIYGTGTASINGDKMGVKMDIAATTESNSAFFMPLGGKSDVASVDFIVFETPKPVVTTKTQLEQYKERLSNREIKSSVTGQKSQMDINLSLNVKPNTDFQLVIDPTAGGVMKGRGNGTLNIHINPGNSIFTMYGDYDITEGSYLFTLQNIINKRFIIEPGSSIAWAGSPTDARLNITAIYKLKASLSSLVGSDDENFKRSVPVECEIKLTDGLSQPTIAFDVQLPNSDADIRNLVANTINTPDARATQFFWLIAANTFYSETGVQGPNLGAASTSAIGFEFLSNQLTNWLSSDKYDIGMRYRPKSELTSDEIDFVFSTNLIGNRLQLDVESNFDLGNNVAMNTANTNNISGDVSLTGVLDKSGRLRAKVFTRTIDRFDENRGLQESGVGIYYKEDFNRFAEVITGIKDWFLGKRKMKTDTEQTKQDSIKTK